MRLDKRKTSSITANKISLILTHLAIPSESDKSLSLNHRAGRHRFLILELLILIHSPFDSKKKKKKKDIGVKAIVN